jgi:hypothetical protein
MTKINVRLRPITEADLPDYVRWRSDPEVTRDAASKTTLEAEREWLRNLQLPGMPMRAWAIEADGKHIGNCTLIPHSSPQTFALTIHIGDKTAWGKGYGTAAVWEMLRIGFEEMKLHRIFLDVWVENHRAIRCYEKCGFRHEGIQRQSRLVNGEWRDSIRMAILREEWEALQNQQMGGNESGGN